MYNFFAETMSPTKDAFLLSGGDYNHIVHVLRLTVGDTFLVSYEGESYLCRMTGVSPDTVTAAIVQKSEKRTELPFRILLFQGLPKSDKLELIIQKCVELGVASVIPVEMHRSVVKLDEKKKDAKRQRWQSIAEAAAKQAKRARIPEVLSPVSFGRAMEMAKETDLFFVPYENENGMQKTKEALRSLSPGITVGILIGPEGGFEPREIDAARAAGGKVISLGERILRTETAAITAVGMCMLAGEMLSAEVNV